MTSLRAFRRSVAVLLGAVLLLPVAAWSQQLPFEQVVARLASADAGERLSALRLLAESGYPEAAGPVAPLLADPEARIQREALAAELKFFLGTGTAKRGLLSIGGRQEATTAARAFEENWGAMPGGRVPIEVVTGLLAPLKDRRVATRVEAAYALGLLGQIDGVSPDLGYRAVVEALADRLGDPEPAVRVAVARAAGRVFRRCPERCAPLAVERVGDGLIRLLNDPDPAIQGAAMEGLGEIRYERAVTPVTSVFDYYKSGVMGYAALDTLARIGSAASAPLFTRELANRDPNFRRAAVEGLARIGGEAAAGPESIAATERDPSVLLALTFARTRTAGAKGVADLVKALDDRDLRAQAQDCLVHLGPANAAELAGSLPAVGVEARVALLELLGLVGTSKEGPAIERLQNDADRDVAAAARRALTRIRSLGR